MASSTSSRSKCVPHTECCIFMPLALHSLNELNKQVPYRASSLVDIVYHIQHD